jgi:hypothetical protein
LAAATGLPLELLASGDEVLREQHLHGLTPGQAAQLTSLVGTPVCGLAAAIGLTELEAGEYQPAVPFISLQSAALAVGRVIAREVGLSNQPNLVQYDGLFGPQAATLELMAPLAGCYCQTNATTIERVREHRRASVAVRSGAASPRL